MPPDVTAVKSLERSLCEGLQQEVPSAVEVKGCHFTELTVRKLNSR